MPAGEGESVFLDGGSSCDPDAAPLTYAWTQIDGSLMELKEAAQDDSARGFTAALLGGYERMAPDVPKSGTEPSLS